MWRDDARLLDMLLAAKELSRFTASVTPKEFDDDRLLQHAVIRLIEIVGETARNISAEFKAAHWEAVKKDIPAYSSFDPCWPGPWMPSCLELGVQKR